MASITGKQVTAISRIFTDGDTSSGPVQKLIDSGLLADLRDADVDKIDRTAFRKFCGLGPIDATGFPTWKTIKLGGFKTANDFRKAITAAGMKIGDWGNDILGQPAFKASPEEREVELVNVSVGELGFRKGATRKDIYERALEMGFSLCPLDVGPQLRLQYKDQPKGEWLLIGMEPVTDSFGNLKVFRVEHDHDDLWLNGFGPPDHFWNADYRWMFLRSK